MVLKRSGEVITFNPNVEVKSPIVKFGTSEITLVIFTSVYKFDQFHCGLKHTLRHNHGHELCNLLGNICEFSV